MSLADIQEIREHQYAITAPIRAGWEALKPLIGLNISDFGKAALVSILGVAALATLGGVVVADKLTHSKVTIREEVGEPKSAGLEFLKDKGVKRTIALLGLGGLLLGTQLLPSRAGQRPPTQEYPYGDVIPLPYGTAYEGPRLPSILPPIPIPPPPPTGNGVGGGPSGPVGVEP